MYDKNFNKEEGHSHRDGHFSGERKPYRSSGSRDGEKRPYKAGFKRESHFNSHDREREKVYDEALSPIKLGKTQSLYIQRFVDYGVYLGATEERASREERDRAKKGMIFEVLLPKNEMNSEMRLGDKVDAFIYLDSNDRPIATLTIPPVTIDKFGVCRVKDIAKIGAFLDWGLPKDLFLPFREMKEQPKEGAEILVRLYIDKSGRLAASEKELYKLLSTDSPYKKDDEVDGRVYELGVDFGIFVAIDDKYSAMIPKTEKHDELHIGDLIHARVMDVKEDGKLDISLREKAYAEIDNDAEALYQLLEEYGGVFPFTEKATPAVIERETGLSKAAFKRAIGRLYKERKITINDGVIREAES